MKRVMKPVLMEQLMEDAIRTVQQMSPEQKAKLRAELWKYYLTTVKCSEVIQ